MPQVQLLTPTYANVFKLIQDSILHFNRGSSKDWFMFLTFLSICFPGQGYLLLKRADFGATWQEAGELRNCVELLKSCNVLINHIFILNCHRFILEKLLCILVVLQQIFLHLLSEGRRVSKRWLEWVLSFSPLCSNPSLIFTLSNTLEIVKQA